MAGWKHGWVTGPTEKLWKACPSTELGDCGGCLCCCCQTCHNSPSIRACLLCFSFYSSISKGFTVQTAVQNVVHVSFELLTRAFSMGGSSCLHLPTSRLLLSGIAFANFSILFAHAMWVYISTLFTFTFVPNSASVIFSPSNSACFSDVDFCTMGRSSHRSLKAMHSAFHVVFLFALRFLNHCSLATSRSS